MDLREYNRIQEERFEFYESLCRRCGACCGAASSDPCAKLDKDKDGKYYCRDYSARIGMQRTISGKEFTCVPIRDVLVHGTPNEGCGYARKR